MNEFYKTLNIAILIFGILILIQPLQGLAQTKPLTFAELITALNTKVPNRVFKSKTAVINYLFAIIKQRGVEKSLSAEMEQTLRNSGATDRLIYTIKNYSPASELTANQTPASDDESNNELSENLPDSVTLPLGIVDYQELRNLGLGKQVESLTKLKNQGYKIPENYFDLAEKSLNGELVQLKSTDRVNDKPVILDIGSMVSDAPFTKYSYEENHAKTQPSPSDFQKLQDFAGKDFDLKNPIDRQIIKKHLLAMLRPEALNVLDEIARRYEAKFKHKIRIKSAVRSLEYQLDLSRVYPHATLITKDTFPPHTSGLAFDIAYKKLSLEEQNFLAKLLVEMENEGKIEAIRESGIYACFHVFVLL